MMFTEAMCRCQKQTAFTKDDSLMLTIVWLSVGSMMYFNPRLAALLVGPEPWFAKLGVLVFIATLNVLWLYGFYHAAHVAWSWLGRARPTPPPAAGRDTPAVALLYLTCNDINEKALAGCVDQQYADAAVFVCDDSDNEQWRRRVEAVCGMHGLTLLRRQGRRGFKAGNINDALRHIDRRFRYVCVVDADNLLPPDFLRRLMPVFAGNSRIAFVQARQRSLATQGGYFAGALKHLIDVHWRYYVGLKNRYGFVMWHGHGAVLNRDVIEAVGGIPEIVTEDLAFSSEARRRGYVGVIADHVESAEEFPATLAQFRRRNRKWVRGTFEYMLRWYPRLLVSRTVSWVEKVDVLISALALLQAIPFLALVAVASFLLPRYYADSQMRGPFFLVAPLFYDHWLQIILKTRYNVFWLLDFYLVMVVVIVTPLLAAADYLRHSPRLLWKYQVMTSFLHLSILLDSAKEQLLFLVGRRCEFHATNNPFAVRDSRPWLAVETLIGAGLIVAAFVSYNLWLLSLSAAFVLTPLLLHTANRPARLLVGMPFILTILIMVMIGLTIAQHAR